MREKKRAKGYDEVKLIFVDVKKARLNAKCEEEEWVELPDEFKKTVGGTPSWRWLYGKAASGWEDDYAIRLLGGRACGFGLGKGAREEIDKWRNDDDQRHGRETLVQNASDTCAEHVGSRVLRGRHWCSGGTWNAVDDGRLGRDNTTAGLD